MTVQLLVPNQHEGFVRSFGLDAVPFPSVCRFDPGAIMDGRPGADMSHVKSLPMSKAIFDHVQKFAPDLLVYCAYYLWMEAWIVEEQLGVCTVGFYFHLERMDNEGFLKDACRRKFELEEVLSKKVLQIRSRPMQRKLLGTSRPVLFAASPLVARTEASWPRPSWNSGVHLTGYWIVDSAVQDDAKAASGQYFGGPQAAELASFLKKGEPPVYVGWGSMHVKSPAFMAQTAVRALMKANKRGIVLANHGMGPHLLTPFQWVLATFPPPADDLPQLAAYAKDNVFWLSSGAAHELLMPLCHVIVHHGGCGTTAASLRSGKPTVITPVAYDQFYWAQMVKRLGVGATTRKLAEINDVDGENEIARAIVACEDKDVRRKAEELSRALRAENGAATAAAFLEGYVKAEVLTGKWRKCCLMRNSAADVYSGPPAQP